VADRLKAARNRKSEELGLDRGTLMSNAVIVAIAMVEPRTPEELSAVAGIRRWQVEAVGADLLAALHG